MQNLSDPLLPQRTQADLLNALEALERARLELFPLHIGWDAEADGRPIGSTEDKITFALGEALRSLGEATDSAKIALAATLPDGDHAAENARSEIKARQEKARDAFRASRTGRAF